MKRGEAMKRTLMAIAAAATLAVSTLAAPAPAHAQRGVAAGVAAGLLGGAIVGGAIASQNGYYGGPGYYGGGPFVPGPPGRHTAGPLMSQAPVAATGSVSGSGMVTPGGCAAFRSATDLTAFSIKPATFRRRLFPERFCNPARKNRFSRQLLTNVYSKLTVVRFLARQ